MAEQNPFDALDEAPSTVPTTPAAATSSSANPFDTLDDTPADANTAATMREVTDQAHMPEVTVSARGGREASWSDVASAIPTAIGAGIETKLAGAQEFLGQTAYGDARKKFWQATVLPDAVRDAKKQGLALTDMPEVQSAAEHLGIRPDTFTRDWPSYVNQSPEDLERLKAEQRDRIQSSSMQIAAGTKRRLTAQQVQQRYAPNMDEHSLKAVVFDATTMLPDILAGVGGTVATGGLGGAAIMAADIAPAEYATARNRGLDHAHASTYALLSTVAASVPEVPVLKIVENAPLAKKVIGSVVGEKLASTGVGKVAGTAVAQGVTQSVVNALQQGIDAGVLNEHLPLDEALKQVAWSGLVGSVVGAPLGAFHAATSRTPKPTTFRDIPHAGEAPPETAADGPGAAQEPMAPSVAPPSLGGNPEDIGTPAGPSEQAAVPATPKDTSSEGNGAIPPKNISPPAAADEHAALLAVKDKSVTPPQADLLEQAGLIKRNDLNEPVLLPAGRRRLAQLNQVDGREKAEGLNPTVEPITADVTPPENQGQKGQVGPETGPKLVNEPVEGVPKPPKPAKVSRNEPERAVKGTEVPQNEPSALAKRLSSDENLRAGLTAMKGETGWAQVGGRVIRDASTDQVSGRTSWIPHADWWPGRPKGLKEQEVHAAIDKALAGQPLRKREQAMVEYLSQVHDERVAMAATHEELKAAVPELPKQPDGALDLTLLASRAAEFDANEAARIMDTWEDDKPETIARIRGQFEQIIGRGHGNKESLELTAQEGRTGQSAPAQRAPRAIDLFGEDRSSEQALADEQRRRDALRSPNRDVPLETGLPGDLFSQSRRQVDFTDQLKQARTETHPEPTEGQKAAGNYRKGRINFGGMEVAIENPKGSTRSGIGSDGKPWSRELQHDYGYFVGTKGADGDAVDAFLTGKPDTGKIFAINQVDPETGKFDEVKVVAGAESAQEAQEVYHANYPRGWKGLGSLAELPTDSFKQWLDSGNTHKPVPGAKRLERREPGGAHRAKVSEMTPEQLRKELLTHELTGIPNRRAYHEAKKLPHQVSIDVDSLKWVNDNMGHDSGNVLLQAIASSLSSHSDNVFHLSGDEFAAQAHTETEAHELMHQVAEHLKNASIEVEMPDGRMVKLKGMGVSYGVGKNLEEADAALLTHKARRQAEGARAARGEAPPGAVVGAREEGRENQTGRPAENVTVKENETHYSDGLLLASPGGVEGGHRPRAVAPGQGALDLFVPTSDPVPGTRAAHSLSRTHLVRTGHFATGIKRIRSWEDVAHIIAPLRKQPQESVLAVVADQDGKVLAVIRHTTGTGNESKVEVYALVGSVARVPGASEVWFAHNHPSGDLEQSSADKTITKRLQDLMRGSGITPHGMIVVAPGETRATYYSDTTGYTAYSNVTAAARHGEVPIQERRFQKIRGRNEGRTVQTTDEAVRAVTATHERSGVLLMDSKLTQMGVLPLTHEEMTKLRTGDPRTGTAHILSEFERANAMSAIVFGDEHAALANLGEMLKQGGVNVLDTVMGGPGQWYSNHGKALHKDGRPFFRQGEGASRGLPRAQVEGIVHNTVREAGIPGFPHVEVHEDTSTLPERARHLIEAAGAERTTGAVYDPSNGHIHLIAGNNGTEQEVRENLWHEAVGHHGLRLAMDGPQYNAIMDGIARDMPERVEAAAQRNGLDVGQQNERRAAAEEVIAYAAGQHLSGQAIAKPVLPYWKRAVRAVKAFFAHMSGKPFYDDNAIAGLIQQARQALEHGGAGTLPGEPSRSTRAPTYYSPVERAVTASKQSKASADQWLATIQKMPGVKPEELEWLNLEPWLKEHKGPITRAELADYVRANKLEIHETLQGGGEGAEETRSDDEIEQTRLAEELRAEGLNVAFDPHGRLEYIGVPAEAAPGEGAPGFRPFFINEPDAFEALPDRFRDRATQLEELSGRIAEEREANEFEEYPAAEGSTQYRDYTLPGGKDYRELLLRLPDRAKEKAIRRHEAAREQFTRQLRDRRVANDYAGHADDFAEAALYGKLRAEELRKIKAADLEPLMKEHIASHKALNDEDFSIDDFIDQMAVKHGYDNLFELRGNAATLKPNFEELLSPEDRQELERLQAAKPQPPYRSNHWQDLNILAHTRFNERTDADGKKVLFIEEIQSDWHQQGRARGYLTRQTAEYIRLKNKAQARLTEIARQSRIAMHRSDNFGFDTPAEALEAIRHHQDWEDRWEAEPGDLPLFRQYAEAAREAARYSTEHNQVPDAPFKTSWPMLVMKRMVRWAAEKGFDRIAWTTGEQQAERFGIEKHVTELMHQDGGPRGRRLIAYDKNGDAALDELVRDDAHLAELVGTELAQRLMAAEPRADVSYGSDAVGQGLTRHPVTERSLTGVDLKMGGEGMRGFYDDILPRETNKLIKKYGGQVRDAQVGTVPTRVYRNFGEREREELDRLRSRSHEEARGGRLTETGQRRLAELARMEREAEEEGPLGMVPAHSFDITPEMKQAALGEGFPMFARRQQALPLQQPKGSVYDRIRRAVEAVHESTGVRDVRKLGNPAGMSPESKQVAQIARAALGELAHETVKTQEDLEHFSRLIDKIPIEDQLRMMDEIERGAPQSNPDFQPVADEMRKTLDTWRGKVQGLGDGYLDSFIENYFPHYWRSPGDAQRMVASIMGRRPLRGPASFLKMRTIPSIKEGMDAGLTPLTTNPLIMTLLKTREMQRFVTGVTLMRRYKEDGLAKFLPAGRPMPDGWAPINDNIAKVRQWSEAENGFIERGQYVMPVDAARVINNHVSASALRDFAPAQIFRRGANALNAMQLGFSAFHLGFTTLDAMISKNAQGIERLLHGEVGQAVRSFGEGLTPVGAYTNVRRGYKLLQAYSDPAGATPEMQKLVRMLELAGGRAHMDRYYQAAEGVSPFRGVGVRSLANDVRKALTAPQDKLEHLGRALGSFPVEYANKLWRGMKEIWATTPAMEVPVEMAMRVVRASTSWIMEHLVPMQKLGVFSDLAADHLRRNPLEDPNARAAAMQRIWDSVDNRLGEMVYDNLFWNRTMKDSLHLGIRAVGWNVGTVREIAGAPVDIVKAVDQAIRTGKVSATDLGHRIPYVLAMASTTALYAATYQYLATGQPPQELKDYFFPRTGGTTNYGTPERVSLPSYVKDVYEYSQRPGQTVVNKLNPIFSVLGNLYSNEDFFGNPITDPEAGYWRQKLQQLQFVGKEATPFSLQGRQQMQATEQPSGFGAAVKKTLPMIGITPAPGYITSGEQMERRKRLEDDQKYTRELKYQMKRALTAHDKARAAELSKEYVESVKRMAETRKLVEQDRAKAATSRRKAAISMRQAGYPVTADLVASLPLEPDSATRQYFAQLS